MSDEARKMKSEGPPDADAASFKDSAGRCIGRCAERAGDPTCPPPLHEKLLCAMNGGNHTYEKIETDAIAFLEAG